MSKAVFSEWIKKQLKNRPGWTGGTLAERAKISRPSAYFYINGERVPTADTLLRIATALDINPATLPAFAPKELK